MSEQKKVAVSFCAAFLFTLSFALSWRIAAVVFAAIVVLALAAFGAIGALFIVGVYLGWREHKRAARAIPERPEWLPAVEPLPEVEPELARIERLRREAELAEWPEEIDYGVESETTKKTS